MVLKQILIRASCHRDLVGKPPNHDTRVIVILNNQLFHLGNGILTSVRHVRGNVRNLSPDYKTSLIAQIVKILIVLVVSQADRCRTELAD